MVDHRVYGLLADLGPRLLVEVAPNRDRVANAARALALESLPFQRVPNCSLHGWFRLGKFVEDVCVLLLGILVTIKVEFYRRFRSPDNAVEAHTSASNTRPQPRPEARATEERQP